MDRSTQGGIAMNRTLYAGLVVWAVFALAPSSGLAEGRVQVGDGTNASLTNHAVVPHRVALQPQKPVSALQRWKKARHKRGQPVIGVPELDPTYAGQAFLLLAGAGWLVLGNTRRRATA